jgi:fatty-acyl-CoA synthase
MQSWEAFERQTADRVRTTANVLRQSGVLRELSLQGVVALATVVAPGARNPSVAFAFHARNAPRKTALVWHDRSLTYAELNDRMNRAAPGLQRRGFRRNTSLAIMMRNRPEFLEVQGGAGRIGAASVRVSWRSTAAELMDMAQHCGAKAILFEADLWPVVEQAKKSLALGDRDFIAVGANVPGCDRYEEDFLAPAGAEPTIDRGAAADASVVIYTSGTTGKPKGAVRKFPKDGMHAVMQFLAEAPLRADDVHLVTCPLYHSTAFGFVTFNAMLGGTAVLMDEFRPETFLELAEKHRVTTTAVVPTLLHRVMALGPEVLGKYDCRSLRAVFTIGAPLSGPLGTSVMDQFGDILFNIYGSTETSFVTMAKPLDLRASPGCIGKVLPGNEVRLLDDDGCEVPPGAVGELFVRSKMLVAGYHDDPASTRASMRDGFFSVGDLARREAAGRYSSRDASGTCSSRAASTCTPRRSKWRSKPIPTSPRSRWSARRTRSGASGCARSSRGSQVASSMRKHTACGAASGSPGTRCRASSCSSTRCRANRSAKSRSASCGATRPARP